MNRLILMSVVCMQFGWIYETTGCWCSEGMSFFREVGRRLRDKGLDPRSGSFLLQRLSIAIQCGNAASVMGTFAPGVTRGAPNPAGVGAYAYQDSAGNRYGGTYGLNDDQLRHGADFNPVPSGLDFDDFFPAYFRNFENILQETFKTNKEYQTKAFDSAKKAYDITSNQAGFMNFDFSRFAPFNAGFDNSGMPNFGSNSAFASGVAMPGYSHQIAAINPENPSQPNVNIQNRFAGGKYPSNQYMSVSSSSYATSSNINGQEQNRRGAETTVNNNGVVKHYKVES